jgi:hypothetical protein
MKRRSQQPGGRNVRRRAEPSIPYEPAEDEARRVGASLVDRILVEHGPLHPNPFGLTGELEDRYTASRGVFEQILGGRMTDRQVDARYRGIAPGMDELVNTSLMRSMVRGATGRLASVDASQRGRVRAHLVELFSSMSAIRITTHGSGHALDDEAMQHPTAPARAQFARSSQRHGRFDQARRRFVAGGMQHTRTEEMTSRELTAQIIRSSIEFTLNYFTAPFIADDVLWFTRVTRRERRDRRRPRRPARLDETRVRQLLERELLKRVFWEMSDRPPPPPQEGRAPWQTSIAQRPSRRLPPLDDELGETSVQMYRRLSSGTVSPPRQRRGSPRRVRPLPRGTLSDSEMD